MNADLLPAGTYIAQITLRTHQLPVLTQFYERIIGLRVVQREEAKTYLSATGQGPALLVLEQAPAAPRQDPRQPGLYHVAFLVPNRLELARWFRHLQQSNWPLQGLGDHLVSEAIYLADPDGNGLEIYADRPRETWPVQDGQIQMATDPVDVAGLLRELPASDQPWTGLHPATTIGHIHLQVSNLTRAGAFYHQQLGFAVTQRSYPGALFVAAGGYHHHVGLNTWRSRNAAPRNPAATGLASFLIQLPDKEALAAVKTRLQQAGVTPTEQTTHYLQYRDEDQITVALQVDKVD